MARPDNGNYETTLTCKHVVTTKYKLPGADQYCKRCGKVQMVVQSRKLYVWKCSTCGTTRTYIDRRQHGMGIAMRHHRRNRTHRVVYSNGDGKILWQSRDAEQQLSLPIDLGEA